MSKKNVLVALRAVPESDLTVATLRASVGLSHQQVSRHLRALIEEGLVKQTEGTPTSKTYRAIIGAVQTRVMVKVPMLEHTPPKRGAKTRHLLGFLHAGIVSIIRVHPSI